MENDSKKITPAMKAECMALDKPIAEEDLCPECGSHMTYKPEFTETSYRAFVVCDNPECDCEFEF